MDTELKERIVYWQDQLGDTLGSFSDSDTLVGGSRVKFTGCSSEQIQWGGNNDPQADGIFVGAEGIVERVEVHSWHTKLWVRFSEDRHAPLGVFGPYNSVCFEEIK